MSIADKLTQAAENVELVYQAGQDAGKEEAYDLFWDTYQENGNRTDYTNAFYNQNWKQTIFRPKYDMAPARAAYMFQYFNQTGPVFDLAQHLEELGITIDFGNTTSMSYMFDNAGVTRLPEIDTQSCGALPYTFRNCHELETLDKLILKADGSQSFRSAFNGLEKLKNITAAGVIGQSIQFPNSTLLSKASITSFINALSATKTGQSITFSLTAVNSAFTDGSTGTEWAELIATKPNWTISLI